MEIFKGQFQHLSRLQIKKGMNELSTTGIRIWIILETPFLTIPLLQSKIGNSSPNLRLRFQILFGKIYRLLQNIRQIAKSSTRSSCSSYSALSWSFMLGIDLFLRVKLCKIIHLLETANLLKQCLKKVLIQYN